ncbi:MAG: DUF1360 domain-containing protein [Deltaproteobacteria bacterium]|nr:DUF1360 domain-containing protein [Deltaproteobacteria bacterium]
MSGTGQLIAVALVVMGLSHTIARERIGEPLRRRLTARNAWLGYLVSCPYCLSHWIAMILVPLTGTYPIDVVVRWGSVSAVVRWFLASVLGAVLAAFFRVIFYFVDETQGLVRRRQQSVDEEVETQRAIRAQVTEPRDPRRTA